MAYLTVGAGQQFATVSAAVAASHDGDTLYVQAGTYQNDFSTVNTKISIVGVGGMAHFVATGSIPNGKAIFITNNDVTFDHVEFSGASVGSANGAGIRQQAGNLTVTNSYFHNNQEGILGNAIAGATVTIDHSEFGFNGAGDGHSHNIYIGQIASLTVTNSYFHDANVGHELKSRAAINILMNNRFVDNNSTASYSIDLPNAGAGTIQNNFIQQGPNSQNPTIIAYAEEVTTAPPGSSLLISGNTILNQKSSALGVWNQATSVTAMINGNHFYGLTSAQIVSGPNSQSGNDTLPTAPVIDTSHPWLASPWDDLISGGAGADVLNGTSGHDLFVGGAGNDTFVILAGGSSDTIADFAAGAGAGDVINLQGYNFANFAAVQAAMTQNGPDTVLDLGNGETLTFKGLQTSAFAADDFNMSGASDTTPPTLSTTTPLDNSTNVAVGANLVLTFSESVKAGSGNLVIRNAANGSTVATIAITDASQVSFSGSTLTINPTANLAPGTHYYVTLASGVVQDLAGNAYAGLSAATDFDFTTAAAVDTTPPTLSTTTPLDNSTNVAVGANLVLTFSESVKAGVGNLVIHNAANGSAVATIAITDASQVSFSGSTLTINPAANLAPGTHYYVTMTSGVVQDLAGNAYAGLSTATDFDFTTAPVTAVLKVPYDFDGDGHSDILYQNDSGQAAVWLMNGTNVVTSGNVGTPDPTWHAKGAGDFDGDGKVDILLQNDSGQAAVWLMNGTTRVSSTNVGVNLGTSWHVEGAGDFNGDGKADILWQNDSGQAQIWLMNGTSILSSATIGANPSATYHIEGIGDFNGDGKSDIVLQDGSGQAAMWLMNGTTRTVADTVGPNMGASWHLAGSGDFNGDGRSDILWQNDSGQAAIWLMSGRNVLSNTNVGANLGTSWHVLGAEDFNGDGKADILWQGDSGQAAVWLMNGTSVLTTSNVGANLGSSWHVTANDDVVLGPLSDTTPPTLSTTTPPDNSTNVAVGANLVLTFSENVTAGAGNLVIRNAANGSAVATIAITDASQVSFSGSVLTINPTSDLAAGTHYYLTMASGVVQDLVGNAYAGLSAATDFDFTTVPPSDTTPPTLSGTAPPDNSTNIAVGANLVLTFSESVKAGVGNLIIHNAADGSAVATIAITDASQVSFAGSTLTINATANLAPGTHYYVTMASGVVQDLAGNAYAGLAAATDFDFTTAPLTAVLKVPYDFDGDGHSDILWQNDSGQAAVWLMNGTNVVTTGNVGTADPTWHTKSAGDFDGDGHSDILLQNDSGQAAVWLMNGTNVLSSTNVGSNLGTAWHVKGAGDFNGDGKADILWQNDSGQAQIWLMNGTGVLSSATIGASATMHIKGTGDFNGDGKADIVWQDDNGQAALWLMNGTTVSINDNIGPNMGTSWHIDGVGDFNGDGRSDILWQNDSGQAAIWLMSGRKLLSNTNVGSNLGTSWHAKGAEDFNGDGKADILWQDDSGQAAVWLMNGTTVLTTSNVGANLGSPWHVTANDLAAGSGLAQSIGANTPVDDAMSQALAANPFDHPDILGGDLIV